MDEIARWREIARRFRSPFVTVDVALLENGEWKIVNVLWELKPQASGQQ